MKDTVIDALKAPLDRAHVAEREKGGQKLSYVEGWHVIAEANRIFGFDGWTRELLDLTENTAPTQNQKGNHIVSFRAKVRVTVGSVVREGTGFGSGIAKDIHDAYESAVKEAETDAMKRAFMTFGNPFGLALYDKKQANVADGPSPVLEALLTNMPSTTVADAKAWKDREKTEIDGLSDTDFQMFKTAWQNNLRALTEAEKTAA
jgi:DNA recombination protein Rad52